mgnify:CR=1 FL=1
MAIAVKAGKVYGLRKMSNIDNIKNYTVIDLEMTGLSAKNDKIIEIGAARVRGRRDSGYGIHTGKSEAAYSTACAGINGNYRQ